MRRNGFETEFEVSIDLNNLKLLGHVDAYNPDISTLIEIKTSNKIPEAPYTEHLLQTQVYKVLTNSKQSYIIYISRSDGKVRVFKVEDGKGVLKWAIERAKKLKEALTIANIPNPERSHLCNYCEFQLNCWR
ncbi:MAG: Dna2/Cas4 domain-containing protein [Sulfolobales archaeon]|nr:Dna2/Cas4 domain-containing protein [Sulfolobales archaeon]MDW7970231.1 Dna2/Cas4 domain-containing protein [Sulfolobales archaeon]